MARKFVTILCLLSATCTVFALPANNEKIGSENDLMATIYSDCLKKESINCIKYKVFAFVDKMLADKEDITLSEGITVVKTSSAEEGAPRSIDSTDLDTLLFDRLGRFLRTHSVKVDLKGSDVLGAIESVGRSFEEDNAIEGRKKKGKSKLLGPLMMAMALKAALLLPLALGAIALIAGKALLVGKIALVISAIIGLKKLLGSQQKHVTYEVVAHPHHSSSHSISHDDGGHGGYSSGGGGGGGGDFGGYSSGGGGGGGGGGGSHGWSRSLPQDAHEIAYRGHQQAQKA